MQRQSEYETMYKEVDGGNQRKPHVPGKVVKKGGEREREEGGGMENKWGRG